MRILLLICVFYAAGTPSAFALKAASPEEIAAIQKQMHLANKMDEKVKKADLELFKAKAAKADKTEIIKRERMLAREMDKQNAARTVAIHMTVLAYGIQPANPRGTSVVPLTKGRTITWLPVAREREGRHIQDAAGESRYLAQPRRPLAGKLYPDGVAYIYPEAFQKGVGYLASTIFHEGIHFEQSTTAGRGDKLRRAEAEVEAYQAEKDNELYFFDPNDPADLAEMGALAVVLGDEKNAAAEDKKERAKLLNRLRALISPSAPLDMFESRVHTNAELADISGLVAQARGQADIARREREEREAIKRAAAEKSAQLAHDERLKQIIGDLALRSCANPGSVTQAELDALPRPYGENFYSGKLPNGLNGDDSGGHCYEAYLYMGRGVGSRLDAEALQRRAAPIAPIRDVPVAPPINLNTATPFEAVFPRLKNIAVTACSSPGRVSVGNDLGRPNPPFLFSREFDDSVAAYLSASLGDCERRLFYKMIETIRAGQGTSINDQWVRDRAAEYSRAQSAPIYEYSPPKGCIPGDNSRRNCIACGNSNCG